MKSILGCWIRNNTQCFGRSIFLILNYQKLNIADYQLNRVFFTSDTHFFHTNIIKYCPYRNIFSSITEMNYSLVSYWNSRIHENDVVFILGDVMFGSSQGRIDFLSELKGRKFLIPGNHDHDVLKKKRFISLFEEVLPSLTPIHFGEHFLVLCHYPLDSWQYKEKGAIHLHGHCHNLLPWNGEFKYIRRVDVGIDTRIDLCPWSFAEIEQLIINRMDEFSINKEGKHALQL